MRLWSISWVIGGAPLSATLGNMLTLLTILAGLLVIGGIMGFVLHEVLLKRWKGVKP